MSFKNLIKISVRREPARLAAVELLGQDSVKHNARNGTRSEPRHRIILFFQISVFLFYLDGAEADILFRFGIENDNIVAHDVETDRLIDRIIDRTEHDGR